MSELVLVIGNRNYSSWSLRAWLALKMTRVPFTERMIPLYEGDWKAAILAHSPAGRVPVLKDGAAAVWDSLAIGEFLAERFPAARLWPDDATMRAEARAVSAEMHSGFPSLRAELPMNLRRRDLGRTPSAKVEADIARITTMWEGLRRRHSDRGPFLFGRFSIADAMYAPVATRFRTYGVKLPPLSQGYVDHVLAMPEMQEWLKAALAEGHPIADYDR